MDEDRTFQDIAPIRPEFDFQGVPQGIAHLDFGSRNGGGVVGPKLGDASERQADKFEVKEGLRLPHVTHIMFILTQALVVVS